jgi:hypothetical protein
MPTPILVKSKFQVPFLGEKLSTIRGLDPLGLQITSESTYGILLPGLTNVTHRIRYYGFYCWLLGEYAEQIGEVDAKRQQNFVRRAELMIALIIRSIGNKPLHIPGSSFADRMILESSTGSYQLDTGADSRPGGNPETYWKARMGAFGQYYAGSMRALGLVATSAHDDQLFVRTNSHPSRISGQQLAEAFAESIPKEILALFIGNIESGRLLHADIKILGRHFDLSRLSVKCKEQEIYLQLLDGVDWPTREAEVPTKHRATSLRLALSYIQQDARRNWRGFLADNYFAAGEGAESATLQGWYFYQLNEYWQVACGSILEALLSALELEDGGYAHVPTFLTEFTHQVVAQLQDLLPGLELDSSVKDFLANANALIQDEETYATICQESGDNKLPIEQAAAAIALIWQLFRHNKAHFSGLREYGKVNDLLREGNFIDYARNASAKLEWTISEYIYDFLYRDIVVRHQYVAMRKMGAGLQSTLKFEVEGEWFRRIDTINARFSGPRLDVLLLMAADLHLLDQYNMLTVQGRELISQ